MPTISKTEIDRMIETARAQIADELLHRDDPDLDVRVGLAVYTALSRKIRRVRKAEIESVYEGREDRRDSNAVSSGLAAVFAHLRDKEEDR